MSDTAAFQIIVTVLASGIFMLLSGLAWFTRSAFNRFDSKFERMEALIAANAESFRADQREIWKEINRVRSIAERADNRAPGLGD